MILTTTLNAALDVTYRVKRLDRHATHRVQEVAEAPGGKGLNVARVLAALGQEVTATGFLGGTNGATVRTLLREERRHHSTLREELLPIADATRRTLAVVDTASGDTTQFNEPGPHIRPPEWQAFLGRFRELLQRARAVALCGSLPRGLPVGSYATLIREARRAQVPVLLDTSGEPLQRGLAARPDLVKPNLQELADVTGSTDPLEAARGARRRGARAVVASLGAEGLMLVTADGARRVRPPRRFGGNPTGAGDSAVAGLLLGMVRGWSWSRTLTEAAALAAATVRAPRAGEFDPPTYAEAVETTQVLEGA